MPNEMLHLNVLCAVMLLAATGALWADSRDEEALDKVYGGADFITIATGQRQLLSQAPSTASVITAADIESMGATDLDQVLEVVPGVHVSNSPIVYNSIYIIRGIYTASNPQVLVLINGIPITNLFHGDRNPAWGGMPVKDIARIEVVRGPGSALYGADAFAGTINIITKTAQDIEGIETGIRAGSFNTKDAWLLHGKSWGGFDLAFSMELHSTDGQDEFITADAQTASDQTLHTHASLAPGPVNTGRDTVDARLDLARNNWRLRLGYQGRYNVGTGAGVSEALDPAGEASSSRYNADLSYDNPLFTEHWDVKAQLSYLDVNQITTLTLFPPGAFGGTFPDGFIGNPEVYERHTRAGVEATYTGIAHHRVHLGSGFYLGDLYKVRESKNFSPTFAPLGAVVDVSDTVPFLHPAVRRNYYGFAQDEWSFAPDWTFTGGLRLDHYSDFGNTLNPRLALVWQTRQNLTSKLLFGRAFRAPSFAELYNQNNPVDIGNPALKPETISTSELAFDYKSTDNLNTRLGFFNYKMKDIIHLVGSPPTEQNTGSQTGYGLEWEGDWQASRSLRLKGNYAFQRSTDETSNRDAGNAPHHHIYVRAEWKYRPGWMLTPQVNGVAGRKRVSGDTREAIDDYVTLNLTLRRKMQGNPLGLALMVNNVFDTDAREPTQFANGAANIPNDLPLPGRNVLLEVGYDFQ